MKNHKPISLLVIQFILFFTAVSYSSECYDYHTHKYHTLFMENDQIIFRHTVKDPNTISYVSQENVVLDKISGKDFKIHAENKEDILFSTTDGYFIIHKDISQAKKYGTRKIENVDESIGMNFFCINNQWKFISTGYYTHKNTEKVISQMPDGLEEITDFPSNKIFLKNSESVFYFDTEKFTFHKIEGLIGKNTNFFRLQNNYTIGDGFLYDHDTFYRLSVHHIDNLTSEFLTEQNNTSFTDAIIHQFEDNISIDTNNGFIWLYKKNGLLHREEGYSSIPIHFVPKKASYLNANKEFITYKNKVYIDFYDLVRSHKPIDFTLVKDREKFHKENEVFYADGIHKYKYDYNAKSMKPISWAQGSDQFYPRIHTYNSLGNMEMFASPTHLYFLSPDPKSKATSILHTSDIKNLTLAIAYDDKLLIEHNAIQNIADRKTMSFLGSTVAVISRCDGGDGQYPVKIDVYYFFKDKDHLYVYNTYNQKMRILDNLIPNNYQKDTYEQLVQLMQAAK